MTEDWRQAEVAFATHCLENSSGVVEEYAFAAFDCLRGVWLEDVKRFKAYLIWEDEAADWDPSGSNRRYLDACRWWKNILHTAVEQRPEMISLLTRYIRDKHGADLTSTTDKGFKELIELRAHRLWEADAIPNGSSELYWKQAEEHVERFTLHLMRVVCDSCEESRELVWNELHSSQVSSFRTGFLCSSLEALIVLYLVAPYSNAGCDRSRPTSAKTRRMR